MCLSILSFQTAPAFPCPYPFILVHNRDEFEARPFLPAHFWQDDAESFRKPDVPPNKILGGKDLKGGGMWLGITPSGRFAAITNFRDPTHYNPDAPSRGFLVKDFLQSTLPPAAWIEKVSPQVPELNPFNLFLGSFDAPFFYSSRDRQLVPLKSGVFGLSNADLDTPWPKVIRAKEKFTALLVNTAKTQPSDILQTQPRTHLANPSQHQAQHQAQRQLQSQPQFIESLFDLLKETTLAKPDQLPQTGVPSEIELALSSIFVKIPKPGQNYGTVCSTVILVNSEGQVQFQERTFREGIQQGEQSFSFSLVQPPV